VLGPSESNQLLFVLIECIFILLLHFNHKPINYKLLTVFCSWRLYLAWREVQRSFAHHLRQLYHDGACRDVAMPCLYG